MSTRTELVLRIKQLLRDPAAVDSSSSFAFTDTEIIAAIEESRREIHAQLAVRFPEKFASLTTMTYTADSERVALPSSPNLTYATISQVRVRDSSSSSSYDYRALKAVNLDEIQRHSMWGGMPEMYAIANGYIWLTPYSNSAMTLSIAYVPELTSLGASDSPTEITSRFHHVYAWDAAVSLHEQSGEASPLAGRRDKILDGLIEFMHNLAPDAGLEGG